MLLFGSLIGLNETLTGSFSFPYRSVVLSAITIALLTLARYKIPKAGTSIAIIGVAILFKLNNLGFHACTANVLLCGPAVLMLTGSAYEGFAALFTSKRSQIMRGFLLTGVLTALAAFLLFGLMNTYILHSWNTGRLMEYISVKSVLTAMATVAINLPVLYIAMMLQETPGRLPSKIITGILGFAIIALWGFGTFTSF